jgi:hypothetical protein
MSANLIIDVVPRIDSKFKMPTIEPVVDTTTNTSCVAETVTSQPISRKQKVMMDIGTFFSKHKYYITVVLLCIIVVGLLYYMYKTYYLPKKIDCDSVESVSTENNDDDLIETEDTQSKVLDNSILEIDEVINKIINQDQVDLTADISVSQSEIDKKIIGILHQDIKQTESVTQNDNIDSKITNILNEDKLSSHDQQTGFISNKINDIIKSTILEEEIENEVNPIVYDADDSLDQMDQD